MLAVIFFAIAWSVPCVVLGIVVWMLTASKNRCKTWSNFSLAAGAVLLLLSLFRGLLAQVSERAWGITMLAVAVLLIIGGILFRKATQAALAGVQRAERKSLEALWVFVALACSTAICAGSALTTQVGVLGISSNLNLINETGSARRYLVIHKYCDDEFKQFALLALLPDKPPRLQLLWFLPKTSRLAETNRLITENQQKLKALDEQLSRRHQESRQVADTSELTLNALQQNLACIDSLYCDPVRDEMEARKYLGSLLRRRKSLYCKYAGLAGSTENSCAETAGTVLPEKSESAAPPHNRQLELQLAIAASLGFWVPVGLLGAIQYRRDHGPSRSAGFFDG